MFLPVRSSDRPEEGDFGRGRLIMPVGFPTDSEVAISRKKATINGC